MPGDPAPSIGEAPDSISESDRPGHRTWRSAGRRRQSVIVGGVVLVTLVTAALWQGVSQRGDSITSPLVGRTGNPAPSFNLPNLAPSGRYLSLNSFHGHPLVINFWASWCIPCRTEMPLLEQAYRAEGGRVLFVGIDSNDTVSAAHSFVGRVGVTYPVAFDGSGNVAVSYGLFGLPTTIFISPSGRIVGRIIGQIHGPSLQSALKEAFNS